MSTTLNNAMGTAKDAIGSAKEVIDTAKGGAEHVASSARSTFFDVAKLALSVYSTVKAFGGDDALALIGLERRRGMLRELPAFGAGVVVGAGLGFLLAPMSGTDLRRKFLSGVDELKQEAGAQIEKAGNEVKAAEQKIEKKAGEVVEAVKTKVEDAEENVKEALGEGKSGTSSKPVANGQSETGRSSKTHHGGSESGRSVS